MAEKNTQSLPPNVPFPAMRAVLNDVFGVEPEQLRIYREALALDATDWRCLTCDAPLAPFTLCAETRCIAFRLNAAVRRLTIVC